MEKKDPNAHFIEVAKLALRLNELDLRNPLQLIELNIGIAQMAALAQIALRNEAKTIRDSNFRPVVDLETDGRGVDAFYSKGTYDDDGSEVSDNELDYLTEHYADSLQEQCFENSVGAAEYAFEGDR